MKKFIFIILSLICLAGCGASKDLTNDPYTGFGTAESMNPNDAYTMAYMSAVGQIAEKYNLEYHSRIVRDYDNSQTGKRTYETVSFSRVSEATSNMIAMDIVVDSKVKKYSRRRYVANVTARVSPINLR